MNGNLTELVLACKNGNDSGRDAIITQNDINRINCQGRHPGRAGQPGGNHRDRPADGARSDHRRCLRRLPRRGHALDIGLLPYFPNAQYRQVGNAALVGAQRTLLSMTERRHARQIAGHSSHIELATYPGFNRLFAQGMLFPEERIFQQPVSMM